MHFQPNSFNQLLICFLNKVSKGLRNSNEYIKVTYLFQSSSLIGISCEPISKKLLLYLFSIKGLLKVMVTVTLETNIATTILVIIVSTCLALAKYLSGKINGQTGRIRLLRDGWSSIREAGEEASIRDLARLRFRSGMSHWSFMVIAQILIILVATALPDVAPLGVRPIQCDNIARTKSTKVKAKCFTDGSLATPPAAAALAAEILVRSWRGGGESMLRPNTISTVGGVVVDQNDTVLPWNFSTPEMLYTGQATLTYKGGTEVGLRSVRAESEFTNSLNSTEVTEANGAYFKVGVFFDRNGTVANNTFKAYMFSTEKEVVYTILYAEKIPLVHLGSNSTKSVVTDVDIIRVKLELFGTKLFPPVLNVAYSFFSVLSQGVRGMQNITELACTNTYLANTYGAGEDCLVRSRVFKECSKIGPVSIATVLVGLVMTIVTAITWLIRFKTVTGISNWSEGPRSIEQLVWHHLRNNGNQGEPEAHLSDKGRVYVYPAEPGDPCGELALSNEPPKKKRLPVKGTGHNTGEFLSVCPLPDN